MSERAEEAGQPTAHPAQAAYDEDSFPGGGRHSSRAAPIGVLNGRGVFDEEARDLVNQCGREAKATRPGPVALQDLALNLEVLHGESVFPLDPADPAGQEKPPGHEIEDLTVYPRDRLAEGLHVPRDGAAVRGAPLVSGSLCGH
jgi:hypothetical protein